jgi:hypothetical protein
LGFSKAAGLVSGAFCLAARPTIETQLHHCWELEPMNREFRLTLCLIALCALPATATAQGFARPGEPDPRAKDKNDDRKDGIIRYVPHPSIIHVPGSFPHDPAPSSRQTPTDGNLHPGSPPFDPGRFSESNVESPSAGTFKPQTVERSTPPRLPESVTFPPPMEHPMPSPHITSGFRPPSAGMGRGLFGIIGGGFAGIAAILRGIFGRRKE